MNTGPGFVWLFIICGIAYIIFTIVRSNRKANRVREMEQMQQDPDAGTYIILTDSTGKQDTQWMKDYLERNAIDSGTEQRTPE